MRWRWRRRPTNGAAKAKAEAEARLRATQRLTPAVEQMARHLADLPDDEFADRVARAFRGRHA
jgi:hypothetical protein